MAFVAYWQEGNEGINEVDSQVRSYFTVGTNLMYAVGALLGLIGTMKVYQVWNAGDPDTGKMPAVWFGSGVFLDILEDRRVNAWHITTYLAFLHL